MIETRQVELDQDEIRFITALRDADEAAMISVFAKVNGTINLDAPAPPAEKSAPADLEEVAESTMKFITAWRAKDAATLQGMTDQLRGPALPASHVARERTRARAIAPDIRFRLPSILEDIEQVIEDTACRISSARPNGQEEGIFETDAIATQILHGICDFFSLYPNINQMSSEYHVRPYFDLEWDYAKKTLKAFDAAGKVIAVEDYGNDD